MTNGINGDRPAEARHAGTAGEEGATRPAQAGRPGRRTYRLDLDYDGTDFSGWASQPDCRTVQETVERALAVFLRHAVTVRVAGRTDAGVHASAQVASFDTDVAVDPLRLRLGLNSMLPSDVAVRAVSHAADGFDARAASARTYRYRLCLAPVRPVLERAFVWHLHRPIDTAVLPQAASLFVGHRDWSALTPSAHDYHHCEREITEAHWCCVTVHEAERRLAPTIVRSASYACSAQDARGARTLEVSEWVFEVTAASFLHNMVRVMVGSMVDAAQGRLTVDDLRRGIESGERRNMGQTAPARGLCLVAVHY
jgi:tRNA pseudouridine38-40 synthase